MRKNSFTLLETIITIILISVVISKFPTYDNSEILINSKIDKLKNQLISNNFQNCEASFSSLEYTKESNSKLSLSNTGEIQFIINKCKEDNIIFFKNFINETNNKSTKYRVFQ